MTGLLNKIKESFKKDQQIRIRNTLNELISSERYGEALEYAEHNCTHNDFHLKEMEFNDLERGFNIYQYRLKNLKEYIK